MRVTLVCPSYPPQDVTCGVGDYTRRLATELARQGEAVTVVTSTAYRGPVNAGAVPVLPLLDQRAWWKAVSGDVIHLQYTPDLYRGRRARVLLPVMARMRRTRPGTVVTFHTLADDSYGSRATAVALVASVGHAISANEEVTAMIGRRLGRWAPRVTEIPIGSNIAEAGVAPADRAATLGRLGLPADALVVAHFGLIYPGKGMETLLDALAEVRATDPRVVLVIIGDTRAQDRSYLAGLRARAERSGVGAAVRWLGRLADEDASRMIGLATLFVVPFDDGASVRRGSLMAGLAHGCAVISTASRRPSRYLRDGHNVALVPARDAAALAKRMEALLRGDVERATLRHGARVLAESFSWSSIASATRGVYEQVAIR